MEDLRLHVPSIGCQGCMKKIVNALQALPGIEIVETNVSAKYLALRYAPPEVSPGQIEQAIHEIGHRVAPREPERTRERA